MVPGFGTVSTPQVSHQTWTLPVLSRGLLYATQNTRDVPTSDAPRLCYDLRGR